MNINKDFFELRQVLLSSYNLTKYPMTGHASASIIINNNYRPARSTSFGSLTGSHLGHEGGIEAVKAFMDTGSVCVSGGPEMSDPFIRRRR
jgi:hypothetical protein